MLNEASVKRLRVFDFDDTLVHVVAKIHVTHGDGRARTVSVAKKPFSRWWRTRHDL